MGYAETAASSIGDVPIAAKTEQITTRLDDIARRLRNIQDRIDGAKPSAMSDGANVKHGEPPPLRRQLQNLDRQSDDILGLVSQIEVALFG